MTSSFRDYCFIDPDKEYEYACRKLNYYPWDSTTQGDEKQRASEIMRSDSPMEAKVAAGRRYIKADFDRSMTAGMRNGYWPGHPKSVKVYGRMVAYEGCMAFPDDVLKQIRQEDGEYRSGHIPKGGGYWEPAQIIEV